MRHQLSKGRGKIPICLSIKVTIHCIKPRCASTKTPFSNCGPCGCQLRAVRLPAAGRTARNRKTKKYIRDKHILQGASGSFPPGIGTLYPGDCPAHTRYNPIFHTVFRMQAQSIIRRKNRRNKMQTPQVWNGNLQVWIFSTTFHNLHTHIISIYKKTMN